MSRGKTLNNPIRSAGSRLTTHKHKPDRRGGVEQKKTYDTHLSTN